MKKCLLRNIGPCLLAFSLLVQFSSLPVFADDPPPTPEDLEREAAIAAFTAKQKAANYGEKFKQAAEEFGIPVEILMGISFAETRHEHLIWPEGETVSPENGMPRPYGIMSLWDNDIFGHSLVEAAKLIHQDPEVLKKDPLQNMRGAAALLKKLYNDTDKPEYAKDSSLESWKYAIRKYCGIDEIDLADSHATDVYDFLAEGYDQYGIALPQTEIPKIKDIRDENKKIREEQRKINEEKWRAEGKMDDVVLEEFVGQDGMTYSRPKGSAEEPPAATLAKNKAPVEKEKKVEPVIAANPVGRQNSVIGIGAIALCVVALAFLIFRKKPVSVKK